MNDAEFLTAFERCTLGENEWTHRAHVRMAWLYLQRGPLAEMLPIVRAGIQRLNATRHRSPAYHETITQAFLILLDYRMRDGGDEHSFAEFCAANPDLLDSKLTALDAHYRRETLFSDAARASFIAPDLRPLPKPQR